MAEGSGPRDRLRASQDMSQPLTVILGIIDILLLDISLDTHVRGDLLTVQREAHRLRHLAAALGATPRDPPAGQTGPTDEVALSG
jgi:hypothetical protein